MRKMATEICSGGNGSNSTVPDVTVNTTEKVVHDSCGSCIPETESQSCQKNEKDEQDEKQENNEYPTTLNRLRPEILETFGPELIQKFDHDENTGLSLYCYTNSDNFTATTDPIVKECRGVVFHGNNIILKSFPYTPEIIAQPETEPEISNIIKNIKEWRFFVAYEGTLLRLFFFGKKWYLSTHRKLDAFGSKWASEESFGSLFKKALLSEEEQNEKFAARVKTDNDTETILERFCKSLDVNQQYMFLLRNNDDNRIVCHAPDRPMLFHVGTFSRNQNNINLDEDIDVPHPEEVKLSSVSELIRYTEAIDVNKLVGVICFGPNNTQLKIVEPEYDWWFRIRGNQSSIKFRYLQLRHDEEKRKDLETLYPDSIPQFEEYEKFINGISQQLYCVYVEKYINKLEKYKNIHIPYAEHQVLKACHLSFLHDRRDKISIEKIMKEINRRTPTELNHMIKRYRTNLHTNNTVNAPGNNESLIKFAC